MFLTAVGEEAGLPLKNQISLVKELGWRHLEVRDVQVEGYAADNLHDIPDAAFDEFQRQIEQAGVQVVCFGSRIANWAKRIDEPADSSYAEARRCIPRMKRLGTPMVRVMSFQGKEGELAPRDETLKRLQVLTDMFAEHDLQVILENCSGYGGSGWKFLLDTLQSVKGLKLLFDMANPIHTDDFTRPGPRLKQDPWEIYRHVRPYIVHVHVKDERWDHALGRTHHLFPGEGTARVEDFLSDLLATGYDQGFSIEPHMPPPPLLPGETKDNGLFRQCLEFGRRTNEMMARIRQKPVTAAVSR
jgi:sugar phosphate isomerase/epimerase